MAKRHILAEIETNISIILWGIRFFSASLMLFAAYRFNRQEIDSLDFSLHFCAALLFLLINEMIIQTSNSSFLFGVFLSLLVMGIHYYANNYKFHLFSIETLHYVVIDVLLRLGDQNHKRAQKYKK